MRTYHGWVVVEATKDTGKVSIEYFSAGKRRRKVMGYGNRGSVDAITWWDKHLNNTARLEPAIGGCYRVYTEEVK